MVQGADISYRMSAEAFRQEFERRDAFSSIVARFERALLGFIMQSVACNAMHSVEQRLARWLLMAQDRMQTTDFPLNGLILRGHPEAFPITKRDRDSLKPALAGEGR